MRYKLIAGSFQPDESYNQLLKQSLEHTKELHEMLLAMQQSYPVGHLNRRELYKTRNCIICAIESLL